MENETFDFENRTYINPDLSRDEQMQFIDTLRGMQDRNAQEIGRETHALGTDVPSNLGGLGGAEETWNARYQEPQMNTVAAQLKTAAQQTALNNALSNYSNMLQNRYNQAYRDYQKRAYNYSRSNTGGGTNPTNPSGDGKKDPDLDTTKYSVVNDEGFVVDAMYLRKVQDEQNRLMKEQGLSFKDAYDQAMKNLGINVE